MTTIRFARAALLAAAVAFAVTLAAAHGDEDHSQDKAPAATGNAWPTPSKCSMPNPTRPMRS